jgi:caa(3)-type oxidase subunit IV
MSTNHDDHGFNANKIFWVLFVLTAVEVGWSLIFKHVALLENAPRWLMWGGLLGFAFWKGTLIYMYFMHMKFEGPVVKWLMRPTPVLMAIVVFALMPDIGRNDQLVYPVGTQLERDGKVRPMWDDQQHGAHGKAAEGSSEKH